MSLGIALILAAGVWYAYRHADVPLWVLVLAISFGVMTSESVVGNTVRSGVESVQNTYQNAK
ncbi:hypothetical protein [Embleya sp. NPDC005575]|uniref:hypothetical protein n=1 Tax=Embleya sp. NPDC005575 TaxID=3156892 RepID=UPI0033AAFBC8